MGLGEFGGVFSSSRISWTVVRTKRYRVGMPGCGRNWTFANGPILRTANQQIHMPFRVSGCDESNKQKTVRTFHLPKLSMNVDLDHHPSE